MGDDFHLDRIQCEGNAVLDPVIAFQFSFIGTLPDSRVRIVCLVADIRKIGDGSLIFDRYGGRQVEIVNYIIRIWNRLKFIY